MKIVEVNKSNREIVDLINNSSRKENLKSFVDDNFIIDTNTIYKCIAEVEKEEIKNYCIYTGQKDTRFVQMIVEDLSNKHFLEKSISYAFSNLDCYTITIFTDKKNKLLEELNFENLGNDNGIITYIKDKEIEKEVGRLRL